MNLNSKGKSTLSSVFETLIRSSFRVANYESTIIKRQYKTIIYTIKKYDKLDQIVKSILNKIFIDLS